MWCLPVVARYHLLSATGYPHHTKYQFTVRLPPRSPTYVVSHLFSFCWSVGTPDVITSSFTDITHVCEELCHHGDCPKCPKDSTVKCRCGKSSKVSCALGTQTHFLLPPAPATVGGGPCYSGHALLAHVHAAHAHQSCTE